MKYPPLVTALLIATCFSVPASAQDAAPHLAPKSVKLFDPLRGRTEFELAGGVVRYRGTNERLYETGLEFSIGQSITSVRRPFFITGSQSLVFRALDSESFALSLLRNGGVAGVILGPFEPEAGVGFSLFLVDAFHGDWSFSMFSPIATAGFGLRFGKLRFGAHGHTEYLWRWMGDQDYFVQGATLSVRLETQAPRVDR